MALGNVIGSNVFNVIFILGVSSTISPIEVESVAIIDTIIALSLTLVTFVLAKTKNTISRIEGFCMITTFIVYSVYIFNR